MYDAIIGGMEGGFWNNIRDAGISGLGMYSENLGRLAGLMTIAWDNRENGWEIMKGDGSVEDIYESCKNIAGEIIGDYDYSE